MNPLTWFSSLVTPYADYGPLAARLALGIIFVAHGAQKLFGWFGGPGLRATNQLFGQLGVRPGAFWGTLVGGVEFFGGACVLLGLVTREAALALALVMIGAIWLVHWPHGFFLDHTGPRHGIEFNVALLGLALALVLTGGGALALDGWLALESASSRASIESEVTAKPRLAERPALTP